MKRKTTVFSCKNCPVVDQCSKHLAWYMATKMVEKMERHHKRVYAANALATQENMADATLKKWAEQSGCTTANIMRKKGERR